MMHRPDIGAIEVQFEKNEEPTHFVSLQTCISGKLWLDTEPSYLIFACRFGRQDR